MQRIAHGIIITLAVAAQLTGANVAIAQIDDVFGNALSKVAGFNGSIAFPSGISNPNIDYGPRLAMSLKYGPFKFGPEKSSKTAIAVSRTTSGSCVMTVDSTVTSGGDTIYRSKSTVTSASPCTAANHVRVDTVTTFGQENSFTLAFGYAATTDMKLSHDVYSSDFTLGGLFLIGIVNIPVKLDPLKLSLGVGGGLYSASDVKVLSSNAPVALMAIESYFAPQVFAGIALTLWDSGLQVFADYGFEGGGTIEPKFSALEEGKSIEAIRATLPAKLDMSNTFARVGLSLSTKAPD